MRNKLLAFTLTLMCTFSVFAQTGRFNWFPNQGNVGIGTRTPSKDLEVIGDLNVTGATTSNSVQATTLQSGSLLNLNNALINGRLGIGGVANPSEALDVLGNLKLSGNITAQGVSFQTLSANWGTFGSLTVNQNVNVGGNIILTNNLSALGITSSSVNTQTLTAGSSTFSETAFFAKDVSVSGKLGIGVAQPNELLEVGGNIKSTGSLLSQSITTGAAQLASLAVNQNSAFNGLVGIGTSTPAEKLHVAGNIKADNTITSSALNATNVQAGQLSSGAATFSDNLSVAKDVLVTGKVGIGVASPSESLDVNGNLKLTGSINAASLNVNQGSFSQGLTAGNTAVNGSLEVAGQASAQSLSVADVNVTNNTSVGRDLTVTGQSTLTGGANLGGATTTNNLQVNGTLNANGISINSLNTTGNATVGQDLSVAGKGQIGGDLSVTGQLSGAGLHTTQNVIVDGRMAIGKTNPAYALDVSGTVNATSLLVNGQPINPSSATNFTVDQNLTVSGLTTLSALNVNGTFNANSLSIRDITTSANTTVGQNLTVNGTSQLNGDLNVTGNMKGGIIQANEFRSPDGTVAFNFQNTMISQTLGVAITNPVPSNYKLAVGGVIIATGIDLKAPTKWPDYVFKPNYKLMDLGDLNNYLKKNGHLPSMPSDEEMQKNQNYSVSEMDAKLLEKVEELTLYIIQLEKRIKELEKK
ncbi:MAG TPA: hypothetical protein VL728_10345 [Cyclobacteriaceae bacterium]|jgi:predicted acyltransferase (DUF342 family)|nr:hypothetical protein [Cyclobacteriaceae bacterium]